MRHRDDPDRVELLEDPDELAAAARRYYAGLVLFLAVSFVAIALFVVAVSFPDDRPWAIVVSILGAVMVATAVVGIVRWWGAWWRVAVGLLIGTLGVLALALVIGIWVIVAEPM